ncbi:MAG: RNA polymerase sigma factor [Gallionella sp.]|jgi:RNA polymerase sigma-70 factor (ECF subfamily)
MACFIYCVDIKSMPVSKERQLATQAELGQFLSRIERRAYKHAVFAMHDSHTALDVVQDAMIKLAEKYGDKPAEELPLLFHRILQNTIRDHCRRQKVRSNWTTLFSAFGSKHEEEEFDPLDVLEDSDNQSAPAVPDAAFGQKQTIALIEQALSNLPARQREAFLLRYWEGLDTAETAKAMSCTEGSVKTHCSRANHALATVLKAIGVELP